MKRLLMYVACGIVCGLFLLPAGVATATELVWTPINPSFGGPSYNATWLMASAMAQNTHVEKAEPYKRPSPFEDFEYNLQRQYLSRFTMEVMNLAFGEESVLLPVGETEAQYTVGDFTIDITTDGQITVVITDTLTGSSTTVEVPYY